MNKSFIRNPWLILAALALGLALGLLIAGKAGGPSPHPASAAAAPSEVWTCSMHPQVRLPEPGACPLCAMDLIPATDAAAPGDRGEHLDLYAHTLSAEAAALADIRTARVAFAAPEHELRLTGKIAADERTMSSVAADFSGRIESLFVNFTGQPVRKGEKLAEVYSPELVTAQQELLEAAKLKTAYPALYEAAREKLRLWNIPEERIEAVESRGRVMTVFEVASSAEGVVLTRNVARGDYVSRGDVLFEIADLRTVWVLLDAYESDLGWLRAGQTAAFSVEALPGREFRSTVRFIDPQVDPRTRTAAVRAEAPNSDGTLKPGMFVRAKLSVSLKGVEKAFLVPRSAVLWTGPRSVVWVRRAGDEPVFEMREVALGPRAGDHYLVEEGLAAGEEVVAHGAFALDAAAQLSGRFSMMNRPEPRPEEVPALFLGQLDGVTGAYLSLQQALAHSSFDKARASVRAMTEALAGTDMTLLKEPFHEEWMRLRAGLRDALARAGKAADLEALRTEFLPLSLVLIETFETLGPSREPLYRAHCPMAFDDQGGDWITDEPKIENPYFGDAMFTCGEIKGRIVLSPRAGPRRKPVPSAVHIH